MGKQRKRLLVQSDSNVEPEEHQSCEAEGCLNVVAVWARPNGYSGPIYCTLHAHLEE